MSILPNRLRIWLKKNSKIVISRKKCTLLFRESNPRHLPFSKIGNFRFQKTPKENAVWWRHDRFGIPELPDQQITSRNA